MHNVQVSSHPVHLTSRHTCCKAVKMTVGCWKMLNCLSFVNPIILLEDFCTITNDRGLYHTESLLSRRHFHCCQIITTHCRQYKLDAYILNEVWCDIECISMTSSTVSSCCSSPGCSRSRWTATLRSRLSRSFSSLERRISLWYSTTVSLMAPKISSAAAVSLSLRNTFNSSSLVIFPTAVSRGGTSFCLHPLTRK